MLLETFKQKTKEKFGDKYDISKITEKSFNAEKYKITVTCPTHGEWSTSARTFLESKYGCPKCAYNSAAKAKSSLKNALSTTIYPNIDPITNPIITDRKHIIGSIYCFINKINNKIYIGKVIRNNYALRWNEHRRCYNSDKCTYFHRAILKYGWDSFDRFILAQTEVLENTKENIKIISKKLDLLEIEYIKKYNSTDHNIGYNITSGGGGTSGMKFSEEVRKKMSETRKGEKHWNYGNKNSAGIKVLQFDLNFNLIKEWDSVKDIERAGIAKSCNISECLSNNNITIAGYIWVRKSDYYDGYLQKYKSKAGIKSNDKTVLQYDFNGNLLNTFISCAEAARVMKCSGTTISRAAKSDSTHHAKGFIWIFKDEFTEEQLKEKMKIKVRSVWGSRKNKNR